MKSSEDALAELESMISHFENNSEKDLNSKLSPIRERQPKQKSMFASGTPKKQTMVFKRCRLVVKTISINVLP